MKKTIIIGLILMIGMFLITFNMTKEEEYTRGLYNIYSK